MKPKRDIMVVGERAHEPQWKTQGTARIYERSWRNLWRGPGQLHAMLRCPSMTNGNTRQRLFELTGLPEERCTITNLLWPSAESGGWDRVEAKRCAQVLIDGGLEGIIKQTRLVMLGARVRDAFGVPKDMEYGRPMVFGSAGGHPVWVMANYGWAVYLPHPSGRNRVWNDATTADMIRCRVAGWLGEP